MIRIDLGRGEKKKGEGMRQVAAKLKLEQPYQELLGRFDNDVTRLGVFFVAMAVAFFPQLIVSEYKRVVTAGFNAKGAAIDKELKIIENEIQTLVPFKKELESYDAQKAEVNRRLTVIRGIVDTRNTPVLTLDAIGQSLPEGVWLDSVNYESAGEQERLTLEGKALTNEDVSDFVDRLGQSSYLRNVRIAKVDPVAFGTREVRAFSVLLEATGNPEAVVIRDVGAQKTPEAK